MRATKNCTERLLFGDKLRFCNMKRLEMRLNMSAKATLQFAASASPQFAGFCPIPSRDAALFEDGYKSLKSET
jgi:hypothetical protein